MNTMQRQELRDAACIDAPSDTRRGEMISRRMFIGSLGGLMAATALDGEVVRRVWAQTPTSMFAYVGCYTTEKRKGHGKGIHVYRMDPASGNWSHVQLVEDIANPSFLAFDRRKRFLYAVHGDMTYATAYAIDASTGRLKPLGQQDTGGSNGVHLAVDPTNP